MQGALLKLPLPPSSLRWWGSAQKRNVTISTRGGYGTMPAIVRSSGHSLAQSSAVVSTHQQTTRFPVTPHERIEISECFWRGRYPSGFPDRSWRILAFPGNCKGRFWGFCRFPRGVFESPVHQQNGSGFPCISPAHLTTLRYSPIFCHYTPLLFCSFIILG